MQRNPAATSAAATTSSTSDQSNRNIHLESMRSTVQNNQLSKKEVFDTLQAAWTAWPFVGGKTADEKGRTLLILAMNASNPFAIEWLLDTTNHFSGVLKIPQEQECECCFYFKDLEGKDVLSHAAALEVVIQGERNKQSQCISLLLKHYFKSLTESYKRTGEDTSVADTTALLKTAREHGNLFFIEEIMLVNKESLLKFLINVPVEDTINFYLDIPNFDFAARLLKIYTNDILLLDACATHFGFKLSESNRERTVSFLLHEKFAQSVLLKKYESPELKEKAKQEIQFLIENGLKLASFEAISDTKDEKILEEFCDFAIINDDMGLLEKATIKFCDEWKGWIYHRTLNLFKSGNIDSVQCNKVIIYLLNRGYPCKYQAKAERLINFAFDNKDMQMIDKLSLSSDVVINIADKLFNLYCHEGKSDDFYKNSIIFLLKNTRCKLTGDSELIFAKQAIKNLDLAFLQDLLLCTSYITNEISVPLLKLVAYAISPDIHGEQLPREGQLSRERQLARVANYLKAIVCVISNNINNEAAELFPLLTNEDVENITTLLDKHGIKPNLTFQHLITRKYISTPVNPPAMNPHIVQAAATLLTPGTYAATEPSSVVMERQLPQAVAGAATAGGVIASAPLFAEVEGEQQKPLQIAAAAGGVSPLVQFSKFSNRSLERTNTHRRELSLYRELLIINLGKDDNDATQEERTRLGTLVATMAFRAGMFTEMADLCTELANCQRQNQAGAQDINNSLGVKDDSPKISR